MTSSSQLVLLQPGAAGPEERYALNTSTVTLGRATANDIDLLDPKVSRYHARLERAPDGWFLVDLNSSNGTYRNDERIRRALLQPGDVLRLGDTHLRYEESVPAPEEQRTMIETAAELDATLLQTAMPVQVNDTRAPRLAIYTPDRVWEVPLHHESLTIGRGPDNDVVLPLAGVSRRHARIERRSRGGRDEFVLRDRGSTNGTWIGPRRIDVHVLQSGDTLRIGDARLVFKAARPPEDRTLVESGPGQARRPVVFVPGLMGSQLWLGSERVWPDVRLLFTNPELFRLPDDRPLEPRGIVDEVVVVPNLLRQEQYSRLSDFLVESLGYVPGVDLLEFAYDWRQDVRLSARRLAETLERWNVTPPVTIIAHSLGTLVTRYYVERLGGKGVVDKLLLLGGPHQGTPEAISTLVSGPDLLPFGFLGERLREVLVTFPSAYQILPRYPCVTDQDRQPVDLYADPTWLPEERRRFLAFAQEFQRELPYTASRVPTVCIFGYDQKTVIDLAVERSADGLWQRLDLRRAEQGDDKVPQASAVLPHADVHPVQQHHGSLYVDSDVKMRLTVELTWR